MQSHLNNLDSLVAEFDLLLPFTSDKDPHIEQHGKFTMVLDSFPLLVSHLN